jgi:hypothetical protein
MFDLETDVFLCGNLDHATQFGEIFRLWNRAALMWYSADTGPPATACNGMTVSNSSRQNGYFPLW